MKGKTAGMRIETYRMNVRTQGYCDIHDITPAGRARLAESGIQEGQAHFFVVGSTAAFTTVEYEPGLVKDLKQFFEKIAPQNQYYHHEETWHDGNGFSHVRATLMKPSLAVPVSRGELILGTWQQVILIDFDNHPRMREFVIQVAGL